MHARSIGHDVVESDLEVDITDVEAVYQFADSLGALDWVVNCAAFTNVDAAEEREQEAYSLNATGVQNLAVVAGDAGARVLHVSTDYVFDGNQGSPYLPDATANPLGAYGRTKLAGEELLLAAAPNPIIIRTAWLFGPNGKNFMATMVRIMRERNEVRVVNDQHGSPTHTRDLAATILAAIASKASGIYHFTGSGEATWFDVACYVESEAYRLGLITQPCTVRSISSAEFGAKAPRPVYSYLDCSSARETWDAQQRSWREAVTAYLREMRHG